MRRSVWSAVALCVAVAAPIAFEMWPFNFEMPVRAVQNGARLTEGGAFSFTAPGIVFDREGGRLLYERFAGKTAITVAVAATSASADQSGPARIVSASTDPTHRNFTLGQHLGGLIFRLRTPATGDNGEVPGLLAEAGIEAGKGQVFAATYDGAAFRIYLDGTLAAERELAAGPFDGWEPNAPFLLGNELTGDRPWLGTIADVAVYDGALRQEEIAGLNDGNLEAAGSGLVYSLRQRCLDHPPQADGTRGILIGACEVPDRLELIRPFEILSLKERQFSDAVHSTLLWLFVGSVFGFLLARPPLSVLFVGLGLFAGALEVGQVFLPHRTSSLFDLSVGLVALFAGCAGGRLAGRRPARGRQKKSASAGRGGGAQVHRGRARAVPDQMESFDRE